MDDIQAYCDSKYGNSYWCLTETDEPSACLEFQALCEAHDEDPTFYENSDSCEPDLTCNYAVVSPPPALLDADACYCDGLTLTAWGAVPTYNNPMLSEIMDWVGGESNCAGQTYWCLPSPNSAGLAAYDAGAWDCETLERACNEHSQGTFRLGYNTDSYAWGDSSVYPSSSYGDSYTYVYYDDGWHTSWMGSGLEGKRWSVPQKACPVGYYDSSTTDGGSITCPGNFELDGHNNNEGGVMEFYCSTGGERGVLRQGPERALHDGIFRRHGRVHVRSRRPRRGLRPRLLRVLRVRPLPREYLQHVHGPDDVHRLPRGHDDLGRDRTVVRL